MGDEDKGEEQTEGEEHPEPTPVGSHVVQDNVTDPDNPTSEVAHQGVTVQDNVTEPGVQTTTTATGVTSSHESAVVGTAYPEDSDEPEPEPDGGEGGAGDDEPGDDEPGE